MTFIEAFDKIKASLKNSKADDISGHLAIQINLNNPDSSGIFYIEINDGNVYVEPFDYYDRDAMFIVSCEDFIDIMTGKKDFESSIADGTLVIEGNFERALEMKKLIVKEKKAAAKKAPAKKTADKKPAAKKTTAKKETKKDEASDVKPAKKAAAKKSEEKSAKKATVKKTEEKSAAKSTTKKATEKKPATDKKSTK